MDKTTVTKDLENKKLIIERVFDVPKEKLWQAYADKDTYTKWWGPEGWTTSVKEFNFVPGGKVHYGMKCIDESQGEWFGQESWGIMHIEELDEPNTFTARDYFADENGVVDESMPGQSFVVEFIEEDGKTRMINTSTLDTVEQLEELIKMGMAEGFSSQLNKLEELLGSL